LRFSEALRTQTLNDHFYEDLFVIALGKAQERGI